MNFCKDTFFGFHLTNLIIFDYYNKHIFQNLFCKKCKFPKFCSVNLKLRIYNFVFFNLNFFKISNKQ